MLLQQTLNKSIEHRMRPRGAGFEFGVELTSQEERMANMFRCFDYLDKLVVRIDAAGTNSEAQRVRAVEGGGEVVAGGVERVDCAESCDGAHAGTPFGVVATHTVAHDLTCWSPAYPNSRRSRAGMRAVGGAGRNGRATM